MSPPMSLVEVFFLFDVVFVIEVVVVLVVVTIVVVLVFLFVVVIEVVVVLVGKIDFVGPRHDERLATLGTGEGISLFHVLGVDFVVLTFRAGRHTGLHARHGPWRHACAPGCLAAGGSSASAPDSAPETSGNYSPRPAVEAAGLHDRGRDCNSSVTSGRKTADNLRNDRRNDRGRENGPRRGRH